MFSTFIQSTRITIVAALVMVTLLFIGFMSAPQAQAATMEELQAMIATLMAQIAAMQVGPTVTSSSTISIGTTIVTTDTLRIRGAAGVNAAYIASQPAGSEGVVVEGPVSKDGYNWYKVDYVTGADGWNVGAWLRIKTDLPDQLGTYIGYMDGQQFIKTENLSKAEATANCKLNATNNPKSVVRCIWRGVEIFSTTTVKPTPRFNGITYPVDSPLVTVSAVFSAPTIALTSVAGPVNVGTVNWGDGSAVETVNALISGREATAKIKHTYATNGTFTITLTGRDGKTAVEAVKVTKSKVEDTNSSLTFSLSPKSPDATGIELGASRAAVLVYEIAASNDSGGDTDLDTLAVGFVVNGMDFNTLVRDAVLVINGNEFESDTIQKVGGKMIATFDIDGDISVSDSDDVEVTVLLRFREVSLPSGTVTVQASIGDYERNLTSAEAEEEVTTFKGIAVGEVHTMISKSVLTAYTLADVKEVTKKTVDPIPTAVDDEYTLYRIVLISGKVHEVKVGFMPISYRDEQFRKTGYTGDIAKLIALVKVTPTPNLGTYIIYYSDGTKVTHGDTSKEIALQVCKLGAATKPSLTLRCTWNGEEIFNNGTAPVVTAPGKNAFACDRSVATKVASGTLACYGMWDYGDNFGGDKSMCGSLGAPKKGCVIQTPVCVTGAAKATEFFTNDTLTTAKLATISTRLKVTPEVAKDGIAGLWEYTCTSPITAGAVLGASTDIFTEIGKTLGTIGTLLNALK